ncbi:universal stress protein [Adhaeribacter radiodurans]|uniref:Universal stress protein n=1 Tax=Adhaeribacter radiodurans TaxID=2745197 RepID=A0A7L7L1J1_9BACT|nr:universal stress protein [Adhaeribacter radiodurans]QMU26662.1 universal stress protein [Adhaeribacter radiodurans]
MKKMLVLTDLTDNSANAYRYAAQLACQLQASIQLVFSFNGAAMTLNSHSLHSQKLQSFAKRYACASLQKNDGNRTECLLCSDKWLEALPLLVGVHQPDLIIAGSDILEQIHQEQGPMPLQALEQYPILWVPDQAHFQAPKHLLFVTDYTDQDPAIVEQVKAFAHLFQAEVTLIHFYSATDRVRLAQIKKEGEVLHRLLASTGLRYYLREEEDTVKGVYAFTTENPVDIILFATRDTHLAHKYFSSFNQKNLSPNATVPLLNLYQELKKACAGNCRLCQESKSTAAISALEL